MLGFIGLCLTVSLVFYPDEAFHAAVAGLNVWWDIVFPALLPFFIASEILMGLGVVHFMGVLLEPLMQPVFRVPGVGSFVMAMGLASGFPIGSLLTAKMRKNNLVSKYEGERLMSFTNTADPLFMFGAVAVGMFSYPAIGATIALTHYLSSLTLGFIMRFYGKTEKVTAEKKQDKENIIKRAFQALYSARKKDNRPIGQLMGDAIKSSVNTLMLVGGFIILFSVVIRILTVLGIVSTLSSAISSLFNLLKFDPGLAPAVISGFFEVTLGCQLTGNAPASIPVLQKVVVASSVIAWSGLSVHAQVASIISETDMSILPFVFARAIHAILAGLYAYLIMGPLSSLFAGSFIIPVFLSSPPFESGASFWLKRTVFTGQRALILLAAMTLISLTINALKQRRHPA
ncbi:MAG TPA: sporulation integral membrane protein YlbJ [Firmicutes bacterium]|nr:sporulation integral membrane protein YlbJ [Bacillota bacterium]